MRNFKGWARMCAVIAIAAMAAGCSDGEVWKGAQAFTPDITPVPLIISFSASPEQIKAGESTTISWKVADANRVQISAISSGGPVAFSVDTTELTGSAVASSLSATTDFVLTVTKQMAAPEGEASAAIAKKMKAQEGALEGTPDAGTPELESPDAGAASVSQTITVTVATASQITAKIWADKESVAASEQTILRWEVAPAEGMTIEVSADSGEPIVATDQCEGDIASILEQPPLEAIPAVGCAVVAPPEETVYSIKATDANDPANIVEESFTIAVEDVALEAEIRVNGEKDSVRVTNLESEVQVSWTAAPANAAVTVTATPAPISCTPALPTGEPVEYTSASCRLSAVPTTFAIHAESAGKTADDTVDVQLGDVNAAIDVRADEWAFEGEEVPVAIDLKAGVAPAAIREVQLTDLKAGIKKITLPLQAPVKVFVPKAGVAVKMIDSAGTEHDYGIRVRALSTIAEEVDAAMAITKFAIDPNDLQTRFTGVEMKGYNKGVVRIYRNGSNNRDIDIATPIKGTLGKVGGFWNDAVFEASGARLPVNAIAVRPANSKEVYFGTAGAVMVSDDGGQNFSLLAPVLRVSESAGDYSGSHTSCRGKTQKGIPASDSNQLVALNQVCDIVVGKGGRLLVATDDATFAISDVAKFRAKDASAAVQGRKSVLYRRATDDLECVDEDCQTVFAASDQGVFKNAGDGESWENFGSLGKRAFSVAVIGNKVYAGTEDGLYESDISAASWKQLGLAGSKVFSMAIDPSVGLYGSMIIAGTDKGISVTRDSGKAWSPIAAGGQAESLSVAIVSKEIEAGKKKVAVSIGSGNTTIYGETDVNKACATCPGAPAQPKPEDQPKPADQPKPETPATPAAPEQPAPEQPAPEQPAPEQPQP